MSIDLSVGRFLSHARLTADHDWVIECLDTWPSSKCQSIHLRRELERFLLFGGGQSWPTSLLIRLSLYSLIDWHQKICISCSIELTWNWSIVSLRMSFGNHWKHILREWTTTSEHEAGFTCDASFSRALRFKKGKTEIFFSFSYNGSWKTLGLKWLVSSRRNVRLFFFPTKFTKKSDGTVNDTIDPYGTPFYF